MLPFIACALSLKQANKLGRPPSAGKSEAERHQAFKSSISGRRVCSCLVEQGNADWPTSAQSKRQFPCNQLRNSTVTFTSSRKVNSLLQRCCRRRDNGGDRTELQTSGYGHPHGKKHSEETGSAGRHREVSWH
eukprot:5840884-Amphidinium_carterae.4